MKNKLPALTAAVLLAAGLTAGYRSYQSTLQKVGEAPVLPAAANVTSRGNAASSAPTAGDQLLVQARNQLEHRASVFARLRHRASMNGRELFGVGGYWQQGTGEELRMRLDLQVSNHETRLLQVSNGRLLWTDRRLPAGRTITRLDLRKVRSEWSRLEQERQELAPGAATWTLVEPELSIRYGGLPTLLLSLSDCFHFEPPQPMRWTPAPPLPGSPESLPVFAVVGRWKPEVMSLFLPGGKDTSALPERLPQEVLLLFGQSDLFPYRIEYRKAINPPLQLSSQPLMLLEFSAVSFDTQIAASQFDYSSGDEAWDDRTEEYLEGIRRRRQMRMANQKQVSPK